MKHVKSANPKEYWKLINNRADAKRKEIPSKVMMDAFVKHFVRLGNNPDADREEDVLTNGLEN